MNIIEIPKMLITFVAASFCLCHLTSGSEPVVKVVSPSGTYLGQELSNLDGKKYKAYRGIPFAEPPVGKLRFMPTVPKAKLEGEYNASDFKPFCTQMNMIPHGFGPGQEDCLYINVFTPVASQSSELLKVLVFIHGGGNMNGFSDIYVPGSLVVNNDIIVVTPNYRLGLLGFMSTNTSAGPGNYGLMDQLQALRWVQENIQSFGGDPDSVTVSGESAGGIDSSILSLSPMSKGLFARVIPMSGAIGVQHPGVIAHPSLPPVVAAAAARREKCLGPEAPQPLTSEEWAPVMECMRAVPEENFASLIDLGNMPFFGPVIDGSILPDTPKAMVSDPDYLASIGFHERDYLVTLCYNEGDLFNIILEGAKAAMTPEQLESLPPNAMFHGMIGQLLYASFGPVSPEVVAKVSQYYEENYEINPVADFSADAIFHIPSLEYLGAITDGAAPKNSRAYLMRFVNFPDFMAGPYKGTNHGIDLLYLFDINVEDVNKYIDFKLDASKWSDADSTLKVKYGALVSSFVKTGKPSAGKESPKWPPFDEEGQSYLEFNASPSVEHHLKVERLELYNKLIPQWIEEYPFKPQEEQKHPNDEL